MFKSIFYIPICLIILTNTGYNIAAKSFGGNIKIELEQNEKFINITWKNSLNI